MAARATPVERWAGFSLLCGQQSAGVPGLAGAVVRGSQHHPAVAAAARTLRQPFIHHPRPRLEAREAISLSLM